jgi:UDP-2,3-diacylglucosamine hydrolase
VKYGLIAGNGRFPVLALETARKLGDEAVVIAIKEEASSELEGLASEVHWISLGELSRLIEICHAEGLTQVMMCGQVKHAKIFSSIKPDWRLFKVLAALPQKNTDGLLGAVIKVLADEGIELVDSTTLLKPLLATRGVLTRRKPDKDEQANMDYGRRVAHALASFDIGQSVAVADRACVALEAMEGTDAVLRRAATLVNGKSITLVKASSRRRHLLFDVPVLGLATMDAMEETGTTACVIDAGRTLLLDRDEMLERANAIGVTIVAEEAL